MQKISEQLVTQTQLEVIYTSWATTADIPRKGKKAFVCWPCNEHAEITRTDTKSDTGKTLFRIEFFRH